MKRLMAGCAVFLSLLLPTVALAAGAPTFDRGLPTANLNGAAGADRSNVTWSNGNDYLTGDDFSIGAPGEEWVVTQIRTWTVPLDTGGPFKFGDEYSSVTLYMGTGAIVQVATGAIAPESSVNTNHSIKMKRADYGDGSRFYEGNSGTFYRVWQIDFTQLALLVDGGAKYYFAVDGIPTDPDNDYWFNHASNAERSGSTQDGADDHFVAWAKSDLGTPNMCDSGAPFGGVCDGGDNKSSDINVQVFASQVATSADLCSHGGWHELMAENGTSFRNERSCVQYANSLP